MPLFYPLPTAGPFEDIVEWIPYLISAVDEALDRSDVWEEADYETAMGYVEDLKAWLAEWDPTAASGAKSLAVGDVVETYRVDLPTGCLWCDGSTYNKVDYPALYDVLDSAFIINADTFKVPDRRNNFALGNGSRAVGATGGAETHTLVLSEIPAHTHIINKGAGTGALERVYQPAAFSQSAAGQSTASAGSSGPHNNMPPFVVARFYIVAEVM